MSNWKAKTLGETFSSRLDTTGLKQTCEWLERLCKLSRYKVHTVDKAGTDGNVVIIIMDDKQELIANIEISREILVMFDF